MVHTGLSGHLIGKDGFIRLATTNKQTLTDVSRLLKNLTSFFIFFYKVSNIFDTSFISTLRVIYLNPSTNLVLFKNVLFT